MNQEDLKKILSAIENRDFNTFKDTIDGLEHIDDSALRPIFESSILHDFPRGFEYVFVLYKSQTELESVLFIAIQCSCHRVIKRLLSCDMNLFATTNDAQNILHLAALADNSAVTSYLLSHLNSADSQYLLNTFDCRGRTPLHYASSEAGKVLFINAGADLSIINNNQRCFLDELPSTIELLLPKGNQLAPAEKKSWLKAYSRAYFESYQRDKSKAEHKAIAIDLSQRLSLHALTKFKLQLNHPALITVDLDTLTPSKHGFFAPLLPVKPLSQQKTNQFKHTLIEALALFSKEIKRVSANTRKLPKCELPALIASPFIFIVAPEYSVQLWVRANKGLEDCPQSHLGALIGNMKKALLGFLYDESITEKLDEEIEVTLEKLHERLYAISEDGHNHLEGLQNICDALTETLSLLNTTNWPTRLHAVSSPSNQSIPSKEKLQKLDFTCA